MSKKKFKRAGLIGSLVFGLVMAGCGNDASGEKGDLEIVYVERDSEVASTYVIGQVLEDAGYDVTLTGIDNALMWEAIANGETDGMVSAWLPLTMRAQYEAYADQVVELGPNLEGAKLGLVVPEYMDVDSIENLSNEADQNITGIDPGAGVMDAAANAIEEYDNLEGWNLQTSSSGAMATELRRAYEEKDEIIVTGWTPHWKFQAYDVKYLDDPNGVFGEAETIETIVREGLKEDAPEAYQILDNFYWESEDIEEVMLAMNEGAFPKDAAADWIEENQDKVAEWTDGIE
ncbi:glycine betaine ABC transporter substrate-binding protein [Oceanobacillus jeddahense]|uniref:Glycine betaine ABC transporter substrate-binding protein n=1 Tax=Oceanobacillus jeddahense TaxID=1462527 RepID=A0ABY5JVE2_9BACI|nr:glycine betaine ABC transporter substrate-binding protein [Oceanobacillus jeddahense]UUI03113.1 glycine betaine ABC transporter substrate-binding protein [Oceanobacillus jeddahense]